MTMTRNTKVGLLVAALLAGSALLFRAGTWLANSVRVMHGGH